MPEVDGIVLAHSDVKLLTENGRVLYDSPFCHFFISVKLLVWKPKKGTKLGESKERE
jgi:DNA-directed RNA polymerase I subunit RPA43